MNSLEVRRGVPSGRYNNRYAAATRGGTVGVLRAVCLKQKSRTLHNDTLLAFRRRIFWFFNKIQCIHRKQSETVKHGISSQLTFLSSTEVFSLTPDPVYCLSKRLLGLASANARHPGVMSPGSAGRGPVQSAICARGKFLCVGIYDRHGKLYGVHRRWSLMLSSHTFLWNS